MKRRLAALLFLAALPAASGADGEDYFEAKVRPLLVERCYECHSVGKKTKGGLALDSRSGWEKGGDSGPALVPEKPDESLLIKAVRYVDPDLSMPPKKRLSADEVAVLTEWVKRGAPDPREEVAAAKKDDREEFAERAGAVIAEAAACPDAFDPLVVCALQQSPPATMLDVADAYGRLVGEAIQFPDRSGLGELIAAADSPLQFTREEIREDLLHFVTEHQLVSRPDGEKAGKLREKLTVLEAKAPVERAMAVGALPRPFDAQIMNRGDRHKLGEAVPRRFLHALAAVDDREYSDDGRLELARAIASPQNPLTARVIVNRVWQQHFGRGLVATADNFGAMGERPSHPELLDHLAAWFIEHGWSIKALHRYILSSATWQQSSAIQPLALERDPANRLLWRAAPRRLEFEPMRDALLAVAGRLDPRLGGRSAPLDDTNVRRAVYGYTDRFRIPALLRNFDVANPDTSISHRAETIHPLQALYFLNSPFVRAQAEAIVKRAEVAEACCDAERIAAIYRRVLSRQPDAEESALAAKYLGDAPGERQWANFVQGLLLSNEFVFCD